MVCWDLIAGLWFGLDSVEASAGKEYDPHVAKSEATHFPPLKKYNKIKAIWLLISVLEKTEHREITFVESIGTKEHTNGQTYGIVCWDWW